MIRQESHQVESIGYHLPRPHTHVSEIPVAKRLSAVELDRIDAPPRALTGVDQFAALFKQVALKPQGWRTRLFESAGVRKELGCFQVDYPDSTKSIWLREGPASQITDIIRRRGELTSITAFNDSFGFGECFALLDRRCVTARGERQRQKPQRAGHNSR